MAGIYRNQTEGIISLSSDGTTRITIADKNLGATQVYNDGDTLSEANAGKYYQWGNNYGFPFTGTVTTSSTQVNASAYGPGNYYNSSTYITNSTSPYTWDSSNNDNLWGGTTGTNEAMQGPCDNGYHIASKDERTSIYSILVTDFGLAANASTLKTYLKMPPAGRRVYSSSSTADVGSRGNLRSSTGATTMAYLTYFNSNNFSTGVDVKTSGYSIRPFKNEAVIPDYTWTKLYGDDISPTIKRFIKNGNYYYFGEAPIHTTGVTLDTNEIKFKNPGETYQLTATITPAGAIEQSVIWSSSDESIATVDDTGLVTCVALGSATITVTTVYGGYTATCGVSEKTSALVNFILVGGGGGGGYSGGRNYPGGGGGGGGVIYCTNYTIESGSYAVTIGAGGAGGASGCNGHAGGNSTFNGLTARGGGGGGGAWSNGIGGGSGGGGGYSCCGGNGIGTQGCKGGASLGSSGGGGGGAGECGCDSSGGTGGKGGDGKQFSFGNSSVWVSGGGGGGSQCRTDHGTGGCGGGTLAAGSYGGGGGGGQNCCSGGNCGYNGYAGVMYLRYPISCGYCITGGTKYASGTVYVHRITLDDTLTMD